MSSHEYVGRKEKARKEGKRGRRRTQENKLIRMRGRVLEKIERVISMKKGNETRLTKISTKLTKMCDMEIFDVVQF